MSRHSRFENDYYGREDSGKKVVVKILVVIKDTSVSVVNLVRCSPRDW